MNSPFCGDIVRNNKLFMYFDHWEHGHNNNSSDGDGGTGGTSTTNRTEYKCLHRDPNQCGRSPTTLTLQYRRYLELSR